MTVTYQTTKDMQKKLFKQFCQKQYLLLCIINLFIYLVTIGGFVIKYCFDDSIELNVLILYAVLAVACTVMIITLIAVLSKSFVTSFENGSKDGIMDVKVDCDDTGITVSNLCNGEISKIDYRTIQKVVLFKDVIIVKLNTKNMVLFPDIAEITAMLEQFINKK